MVARIFLLEPDYTRSFPNKKHVDFFLTGYFLVLAKGGLQLCITPEPRAMAASAWLPCFPGISYQQMVILRLVTFGHLFRAGSPKLYFPRGTSIRPKYCYKFFPKSLIICWFVLAPLYFMACHNLVGLCFLHCSG